MFYGAILAQIRPYMVTTYRVCDRKKSRPLLPQYAHIRKFRRPDIHGAQDTSAAAVSMWHRYNNDPNFTNIPIPLAN